MGNVGQILNRVAQQAQGEQQSNPRHEWRVQGYFAIQPGEAEPRLLSPQTVESFAFENTVVIEYRLSDHFPFPSVTLAVGTILRQGKFVPRINPRSIDFTQKVLVQDPVWSTISTLWAFAENWIKADSELRIGERQRLDAQKRKVPEKSYGGPNSGKTERQRAKGKALPKH